MTWWASSSSQKRLFFNDSGKMHFTCIIENFLNEGRSTLIVQLFCSFSILYLHRKGMRAGKLTLISLQKINSSIYSFFDKTHGTHTSESTIRAVTKIPNIFIFLEADVFGGWLGSEKWVQANFSWPKFSEVRKSTSNESKLCSNYCNYAASIYINYFLCRFSVVLLCKMPIFGWIKTWCCSPIWISWLRNR